jgi:hypothetical protein
MSATGVVTTDLSGEDDSGEAPALQPDGKLVVVGHRGSGPSFDLMLARHLGDRALDASSGNAGTIEVDFFGAADGGAGAGAAARPLPGARPPADWAVGCRTAWRGCPLLGPNGAMSVRTPRQRCPPPLVWASHSRFWRRR